uniref:Major facilitator superfamily (MFS) profile domain-containing protein n=1 Tax=Timema genevievae TaxID=629358 RepID=A0A7R9K2Y9_TIMGE|nr:unnamed protein product [Timema genevievae]
MTIPALRKVGGFGTPVVLSVNEFLRRLDGAPPRDHVRQVLATMQRTQRYTTERSDISNQLSTEALATFVTNCFYLSDDVHSPELRTISSVNITWQAGNTTNTNCPPTWLTSPWSSGGTGVNLYLLTKSVWSSGGTGVNLSLPTKVSLEQWRNWSQPVPSNKGEKVTYDACKIWDRNYSSLTLDDLDLSQGHSLSAVPCTSWEFDVEDTYGRTIISQWSLVCDRAILSDLAQMALLLGLLVGSPLMGSLSDKFGRRRLIVYNLVVVIPLQLCLPYLPSVELYIAIQFLLGVTGLGLYLSSYVLCVELVDGKWRTITGLANPLSNPTAFVSIAGIAYLLPRWDYLNLAISLPALLIFGIWLAIPESPRWLMTQGKKEEVMEVIKTAARCNKRTLPTNIEKQLDQFMSRSSNEEQAGLFDLFRTPNLRRNTLLLYVEWFTINLIYLALVLNTGNIGGNIYVTSAILGIVEFSTVTRVSRKQKPQEVSISSCQCFRHCRVLHSHKGIKETETSGGAVEYPAVALAILCMLKMGRRWPLSLSSIISGVACLLSLVVSPENPSGQWWVIMAAMIGKFCSAAASGIVFVTSLEIFPTVVRNVGLGTCQAVAGVAFLLTPFLWNLVSGHQGSDWSDVQPWLPMSILGASGIVGGLCSLFLPETSNRSFPHTLEDGEAISRSPDRDPNLNLPVLGSLAQHKTSALANYATEGGWKTILGKPTLSTPDLDSNLDFPVIGSPSYCESITLDHAATEVGPPASNPRVSSASPDTISSVSHTVESNLWELSRGSGQGYIKQALEFLHVYSTTLVQQTHTMERIVRFVVAMATVVTLAAAASSFKKPEYLESCPRNDNACLKKLLQVLIPKLSKGSNEFSLQPLDPMHIPEMNVVYQMGGNIRGNVSVINSDTYALSKIRINDVRSNVNDTHLSMEVDVKFPGVFVEGSYKANGLIVVFPINGKGVFNISMSDVSATWKLSGQVIERNEVEYLRLDHFNMRPVVGDMKFYASELFTGSDELSECQP